MPSPDPSAGTVFLVRDDRVAGAGAALRLVAVAVAATVGFGAAAVVAAGFTAAGFARPFDRVGDAPGDEEGAVADRASDAGLSSLILAASWATSARASDACFFRFASTSRVF